MFRFRSLSPAKLLLFIALVVSCSFTAYGSAGTEDRPDLFSYQDIRIAGGQTVERLLVSSADAVVQGVVREGIMIVDGNLTLEPGAWVEGRVIVLGGRLIIREGCYLAATPWVIAPSNTPFTGRIIGLLSAAICLSLIVLPYAAWGLWRLLQPTWLYRRLRDGVLTLERRWPALYIATTLAASALLLLAFSELAWQTVFRHTMGIFDNSVIWLVRYGATPALDSLMIMITNLGYGYTYLAIITLSLGALLFYRRWLELQSMIICLLGGSLLNALLKVIFQRTRPEALRLVEAAGYSFPSGHAMVSLCFYGMLSFLLMRALPSRHARIAVLAGSLLLVGAIGLSRIYLGVHYPSDVLAGYVAGGTWLAFSISFLLWREHVRKKSGC